MVHQHKLAFRIVLVLLPITNVLGQDAPDTLLAAHSAVIERSNAYCKTGQFCEARAVIDAALRVTPLDADLYEQLGIIFGAERENEKAIQALTKAIQCGSHRASVYNRRGGLFAMRGDWTSAIDDYSEAVRIDPMQPYWFYNRACAYLHKLEYKSARADLERAYGLGCGDVCAFALAKLLASCPDGAVRDGKQAVDYAKGLCKNTEYLNPVYIDILAGAYAEAGLWEEAVKRAKQALVLAEENNWDIGYCAGVRMRLELFQLYEPYREFPPERSANLPYSSGAAALLYGLSKVGARDFAGAHNAFKIAVSMNPRLASAFFWLGELALSRDNIAAVSFYNHCLKLDPRHVEALVHRGEANARLGKSQKTLDDVMAALSLFPKHFHARCGRVWALANLGAVDQAFKEVGELSQVQPDYVGVHFLWGHCYLVKGQYRKAVDELSEALQRNPSYGMAYADRAVALAALGKEDEAYRDLSECSRLDPSLRMQTQARIHNLKDRPKRPE
jgi:tetratricopeptide (TPR) repeat protein